MEIICETWNNSSDPRLRIAVGIATRGREEILGSALEQLRRQTRSADRVVICFSEQQDVKGLLHKPGIDCVTVSPGLPRQRNAILDKVDDCDVLLFLDDDFLMAPEYIQAIEFVFRQQPDIVATTGNLIADGARGPGFSVTEAQAMIAACDEPAFGRFNKERHGYGCNMAIRLGVARAHGVRFDERLPLYGWSEDVDYTHRLAKYGDIAKVQGARGVHLGVKQGRQSGRRLGYSQVANPIYLYSKGSYSFGRATRSVSRNLAMNALRACWSEPFIDRRGRLGGNALAFLDMMRGRLDPERILEL